MIISRFSVSSYIDETDKDEEVTKTKTFTLKSGSELDVKIGRERFHAPEILFTASHVVVGCCCRFGLDYFLSSTS